MKSTVPGMTSFSQKIQDVPILLAQGHYCGQNPANKQTAIFTLCAEETLTPNDATTQRSFSPIISRLNSFMFRKWYLLKNLGEAAGNSFPNMEKKGKLAQPCWKTLT
jgi:hypothetical protein